MWREGPDIWAYSYDMGRSGFLRTERLELDGDALPVRLEVSGQKAPWDPWEERFERQGPVAQWTTTVDDGERPSGWCDRAAPKPRGGPLAARVLTAAGLRATGAYDYPRCGGSTVIRNIVATVAPPMTAWPTRTVPPATFLWSSGATHGQSSWRKPPVTAGWRRTGGSWRKCGRSWPGGDAAWTLTFAASSKKWRGWTLHASRGPARDPERRE